ncbi:putative LRR receptor-like serine/threonine-protein kinase [Ananas comosus]|uniref:Putative LRR receptor-like serine/threonine-protein kinase n=1 Tax=Ananas comosus TaxID=4615 RepID=A0A199V9T0_ANACO|nr:putative LRR receptor-like serine/threonine-protein kinase [Ananas comosus]
MTSSKLKSCLRTTYKKQGKRRLSLNINLKRGLELQTGYLSLRQIKAATNNFDPTNKIGEGGFGPVHKGVLPDGSEVAVKQLSSKSKQDSREFINEVGLISALQHPNLVRLFGYSIDGDQWSMNTCKTTA